MRDLAIAERAQLGLEYIEDAIVTLLANHTEGLSAAEVADVLGLPADMNGEHRDLIAAGILQLLVRSGRVIWDPVAGRYIDNPDRL